MNKQEAQQLAKVVEGAGCTVSGLRRQRWQVWELDVVDHLTGYPFVVMSREDWDETVRASLLYKDAR